MPEETPYNSETKRRSNKKAINWFSTNVTTKDKQNKSAKKDIEHPIFIQLSENYHCHLAISLHKLIQKVGKLI